jgi:hypothetical protein
LLLAENFIKLPNTSLENSLKTTIDISVNKLINKNSSDFKEHNSDLISKIKSENSLQSKYLLLTQLNDESLKSDALK